MPRNHKDREERNQRIAALHLSGWNYARIAKRFKLYPITVRGIVSRELNSPSSPKLAEKQRLANVRLKKLHAKWLKTHVTFCKDYTQGDCCPNCHKNPRLNLELVTLKDGKYASVCHTKAEANWKELGKSESWKWGR